MTQFLSRAEQDLLKELSKIIDWHIQHEKPLKKLLITSKQKGQIRSIVNKKKRGPVYDDLGEVEIQVPCDASATKFKGVALYVREERRRYTKKALMELPV